MARPLVGSEYQSNMGQVDGWNYSKHQFKIPATNSPTFRIFSDFGIIGVAINVWKALQHFEPAMVVDKTASAKEQEELKSMTHNQFCEHLAMALINNSFITQEGPLHPEEEDQGGREHKKHPRGRQCRRKCLGVDCGVSTHLICTGCSSPAPPKEYTVGTKTFTSRTGYKHYCQKCFVGHVYGESRHTRKSVKRPRVADSNRARAAPASSASQPL